MSGTLRRVEEFLAHPAPGLVFGEHERAGLPRRVYATPHAAGEAIGGAELAALERLCAGAGPRTALLEPLLEVYRAMDGCGFCLLRGKFVPEGVEGVYALVLYPVEVWEEATAQWTSAEMAWAMDQCPIYRAGEWRVIGSVGGGMSLVLFFSGEDPELGPLAGRMFCIGLDGVLGYQEELAASFGAFVDEFTRDPAAWFDRVGFTWEAESADGSCYGDPVAGYLADVRGEAGVQ